MPDQSVAGDIGGGTDKSQLGKFGADGIDLRHEGDDLFLERAGTHSAFDGCRGNPGA